MSTNIIFLTIVISLLIVVFVVYLAEMRLRIKLVVIALLFVVSIALNFLINDLKGYPVEGEPPPGSRITSYKIIPHDSILLWAIPDKQYDIFESVRYQEAYTPRSYRIPFTEDMAKELEEKGSKISRQSREFDQAAELYWKSGRSNENFLLTEPVKGPDEE